MAEKLLRLKSVLEQTGFKTAKLYGLMARGEFPRPLKIDGCALWPESRVQSWIEERIAASDAGR